MVFASLQIWIMAVLSVALFGVEAFAFIHAVRQPSSAFIAAGKRTKGFWSAILGVAGLLGFVGIYPPLGIGALGMAVLFAVVPAMIYLGDVRKAVSGYRGPRGSSGPSRPHGGW